MNPPWLQLVSWVTEWTLEPDCLGAKWGSAMCLLCDSGSPFPSLSPRLIIGKHGSYLHLVLFGHRGFRGLSDPSVVAHSHLLQRPLFCCIYSFSPFSLHFSLPSFPEQPLWCVYCIALHLFMVLQNVWSPVCDLNVHYGIYKMEMCPASPSGCFFNHSYVWWAPFI